MIQRPSPNFDDRPEGVPIDMLVIHYTGMKTAEAALERLSDPEAKVSAHYVIDENGSVIRLVAEENRAWHAGVSSWRGESDVNGRSIGIELVNPGREFGYRLFTEPQMESLAVLAADIVRRHAIPDRNVVGHSDVAPDRKEDPGELFEWDRLAREGIGLWPAWAKAPTRDVAAVQRALAQYGYGLEASGVLDDATRKVVAAFQRHFRPERVDGNPDSETVGRLFSLLDLVDDEGGA
ncbi:MAG: N-acetylmuramoyl-L-alanine amidase [Rhodospirillales bacterium]|nr:N-acetylmuramoyl-L-alanine amidase [Rhodospirillales bacterium]